MDDDHAGFPPTTAREARAPSQQAQALLYTTWWALQRHHAAVRRARAAGSDPPPASQALLELHRRTSTLDEDGRRVPVGAEAPYTWKLAAFFYRTVDALHDSLRAAHPRGPEQLVNLLMRAEIAAVRDDGGPHALQQLLRSARARWPHLRLAAAHRIALYEHLYVARIARWLHAEEDRAWAATHLSLEPRGLGGARHVQLLADVRAHAEAAARASLARLEALAAAAAARAAPAPAREWLASAHPEDPTAPRRRYPRLDVQESGYLLAALWSDPFSPIKHEALAWLWRATRPDAPAAAPAAGPSGRLGLPGEVAALLGCCSDPATGPDATERAAEGRALRYAVHSVLYQTLLMLEEHADVRGLLAVEGPAAVAHVRAGFGALAADFRRNAGQLQAHALTFLNQCTYLLQYLLYERLRTWATERAAPPAAAADPVAADSFLDALVAEVAHEIAGHGTAAASDDGDEASSGASASEDSAATARRTAFAALAAQLDELATQCRALLKASLAAEATRRRELASPALPPQAAPRSPLRPRRGTSPENEALVPALSRTLSSYMHRARTRVRRASSASLSASPADEDADDAQEETTQDTTTASSSEAADTDPQQRALALLRRASQSALHLATPPRDTGRADAHYAISDDAGTDDMLALPGGETDPDDLQAILDELAAPPAGMSPLASDEDREETPRPIRWNRVASLSPRAPAAAPDPGSDRPHARSHAHSMTATPSERAASGDGGRAGGKKGVRRMLRRAMTVSSRSRSSSKR